jgi:hypothetical protein
MASNHRKVAAWLMTDQVPPVAKGPAGTKASPQVEIRSQRSRERRRAIIAEWHVACTAARYEKSFQAHLLVGCRRGAGGASWLHQHRR